jgi:poly(ribitol-phosphate) beta-N-acetylglucosaminyltransferase
MKLSVVVPVYNPGRSIEPCIQSMLDQSLPRDEFEVLFVDDGSTDETPARLDTLVAQQPNFRVIHTPNSGWSGRPRNIGIAEATGEYVQFLDQDDRMASDALKRLCAMADRNGSDIVLGKVASDFRAVPQNVFRRTRAACTIEDAPLIDSLTAHKLFRRSFLIEHDIRFPEGKRRLDDQLFMVRAYFRARVVSILADRVCYFYARRDDRGNAGSTRIEPESYYANVREVIDVVLANTRPGEFRDRLLRRFYRVEMLGRLSEPNYLRYDPAYRDRTFTAVRDLATAVISEEVDAGLGALQRLRAGLLRRGDRQGLLDLALRASEVQGIGRIEAAGWQGERLVLSFGAWLDRPETGDGPLFVGGDDGRIVLGPALTVGLSTEPIDVTQEVSSLRADLLLRDPATGTEWLVPSKARIDVTPSGIKPVVHGVATIEPRRIAAGRPLAPGSWEIWLRVVGLGLDRRTRLLDRTSAAVDAARLVRLAGGPPGVLASLDQAGLVLQVERELPPSGDAGMLRRVVRATAARPRAVLERTAWRLYYRLPRTLQSATRATYRRVRTVR